MKHADEAYKGTKKKPNLGNNNMMLNSIKEKPKNTSEFEESINLKFFEIEIILILQ